MRTSLESTSVLAGLLCLLATACEAPTIEHVVEPATAHMLSPYLAGGKQFSHAKSQKHSSAKVQSFALAKPKFAGNTPAHPLRYIGVLKSGNVCPNPKSTSWQKARLFDTSYSLVSTSPKEQPGQSAIKLPPSLQRFCVYTWTRKEMPTQKPQVDMNKFWRLDPDYDTVVPQSSQQHTGPYFDSYLQAAGAKTGGQQAPTPATAAMVAVVDTVGFTQGTTNYSSALPRLRHGLSMAGMIRSVRCPNSDPTCTSKLFHTQAFPYNRPDPKANPGGGVLGSQGSLAQAIAASILHWQKHQAANTRLVVNLSVAWDPTYGGTLPSNHMAMLSGNTTVPAPVQAVHAAIAWGNCLDVLFVAASGNHEGDPCGATGTMAPASWNLYNSPVGEQCQPFGIAHKPVSGKFVYAVGGLDYQLNPITKTRADSLPVRAAVGFMGVGRTPSGQLTGNWTGTSVATATVSAIAARLWGYAPTLSPHQLMSVIDSSGLSTQHQTKLITAYHAQRKLCSTHGQGCSIPYQNYVGTAAQSTSDNFFSQWASQLSMSEQTQTDCETKKLVCGSKYIKRTVCSEGKTMTSMPTSPTTEPWLRPQPEIPICPLCPTNNGILSLTVDSAHGTASLHDPVFAYTRATGELVEVTLSSVTIQPPQTTYVPLSRYYVTLYDPATGAAVTQPLSQWLAADQVSTAELRFRVQDAAGGWATQTTSISVNY